MRPARLIHFETLSLLLALFIASFSPVQAAVYLNVFGARIDNGIITYIRENSCAYQSGIRKGDLITAIDANTTNSKSDSWIAVELFGKPGAKKVIWVSRAGKKVRCDYQFGPDILIDISISWINNLIKDGKYDIAKSCTVKYFSELPESRSLEFLIYKIEYKKLLSENKKSEAKELARKVLNGIKDLTYYQEPVMDYETVYKGNYAADVERINNRLKTAPVEIFFWNGAERNNPFSYYRRASDLSENPEVAYLLAKEASLFNSPNTPSMECPFIIKEFRYAHSLVLLKKYDAARRHYINALDKLKSIDYKRTLQTKVLEKELLIAKSDLKILSSQSD
ncbi:MAG: hypothetical protein H6677_23775 [Candidatus Obscuribacterales bacterium]|nr:hypothetical protein [Candidatus Obscuribacterales bacterium]